MITVVGIGIERGDLGAKGKRAIKQATRIFSRVKVWYKSEILSQKYDDVCSYEQLDELMDSVEDDFDYAISGIEKLQRSGNMSAAMEQAQRLSTALQSVIGAISEEI